LGLAHLLFAGNDTVTEVYSVPSAVRSAVVTDWQSVLVVCVCSALQVVCDGQSTRISCRPSRCDWTTTSHCRPVRTSAYRWSGASPSTSSTPRMSAGCTRTSTTSRTRSPVFQTSPSIVSTGPVLHAQPRQRTLQVS